MKKVFKFIKNHFLEIILIGIFVAFVVNCIIGICHVGWDNFSKSFGENLQKPVPIIGVTFYTVLTLFFVILSKTSIGKKALKTYKKGLDFARKEAKELKESFEDIKQATIEFREEKQKEIEEIKETAKVMLDGARQEVRCYRDLMLDIAKEINNVNIQKKIDAFIEENKTEVYEEYSSILENTREEVKSEYDAQLKDLRGQMDEILKYIEETKNDAINEAKDIKEEVEEAVEEVQNA